MSEEQGSIEAQRAKVGYHFREDTAPGLVMEMSLKRIFHSTQSEYQQVDVIETYFGKTLVTDGKTQSAQFDEFAYHESLVHPALLKFCQVSGRAPKTVFIGGGGELATAREILRHPQVEKVVMVDLDKKVVDVSVQYLPEWGGETVKNDPRFELIIGDAYAYLLDCKEVFDAIVMDISDPIEAGPGIMLYTKELYEHAATLLSPNGIFVTQAGCADAIPPPHAINGEKESTCFGPIHNTLGEVFDCVLPYTQSIPSFGSDWGFIMAFRVPEGQDPARVKKDWVSPAPSTIDSLIEQYITGGTKALKMYDEITHCRMYALPKPVRKQLAEDKRIMTKDNPVFMY